tara:strand:- start:374 stop:955 length:582 start_codon:yes stop_codon:yes gene_type:complete
MASEVQICNLALAKIGDQQIISLTENSKAGRLCNLVYEPMRDAVLRSHPWNFAVKRETLALDSTAPAYEYTSRFALPVDFMRLLKTNMVDTASFVLEGKYILCDADTLIIKYIRRETDPENFDLLFMETLSARIAAELAISLSDSRTMAVDLFNLYGTKLSEARTVDATEGTPDDITADTWLNSRISFVGTGA